MGEGAMVIVVSQVLTPEMIEAGRRAVERIDEKASLDISAAFWFLDQEDGKWRLILASKRADEEGPKQAYRLLRNAWAHGDSSLAPAKLEDVTVVSPKHPLVRLLAPVINTGPGIAGIRFSGNTINDTFIEDAYIYRMTSGLTSR